jgi:adenylate cyclase
MDSTVLGLTVNLAKRLEEATKTLHIDMIISDQVAKRLPDRNHYRLRDLGEAWVKGTSSPLTLFEVYDQDPPEVRNLKDRIGCILTEGVGLVRTGHLEAALTKFQEARVISPQDLPLCLFINSLRSFLERGQAINGATLLDLR